MIIGQGSTTETLGADSVQELLTRALEPMPLDGKRVLIIIPDGTRTAPIPLLFRLLYEQIGRRVARLDYLVALGTHSPMSDDAIDRLVGVTAAERAERYPNVAVFNHRWDLPGTLQTVGTISREETARLTDGLLVAEVPVTLNRQIFEYDQLVICGPVFPHEVVGFSGGAKYLFTSGTPTTGRSTRRSGPAARRRTSYWCRTPAKCSTALNRYPASGSQSEQRSTPIADTRKLTT